MDVAHRVNLGLIPASESGWLTACAATTTTTTTTTTTVLLQWYYYSVVVVRSRRVLWTWLIV